MENKVRIKEDLPGASRLRMLGIENQQSETIKQAMRKVQKIITDYFQLPAAAAAW